MAAPLLIGIDVGTTSTKAILCDLAGNVLAQAAQEYPTAYPHANWAQQDPEDWWRATCISLQQTLRESCVNARQIASITVSSQAPTLVPVDRNGRPLHPALIWMDRRGDPQCRWLCEHVGEELVVSINGGRVDPYYLAAKLLWLRAEAPDVYAASHQFLQANGYIVHRLSDAFCMDASHGPLTQLFDSTAQDWSPLLLDAMALDPTRLPSVLPCTAIAGEVTRAAAAATGLAAGTPVVAGMVDATAAGIEAGLLEPGQAAEVTGQSTVLLLCSDRPYTARDLIPVGHPVAGRYLVLGALVATGGALRWFRDQLGEAERKEAARLGIDPFELLGRAAKQSPPGANRVIFLPYMFGERSPIWDSNARGVFFGLSLATTKRDLVRAIMEGAAFGLRHNVEVAAAAGFALDSLACIGGGSRSALWNQIKADVLHCPIRLPRASAGAPMGDAIVGAVGVGLYPTVGEAVAHMIAPGPEFAPVPGRATCYDSLYRVYRGLYPALRASFQDLAEVDCR
jgi:xylulokinase